MREGMAFRQLLDGADLATCGIDDFWTLLAVVAAWPLQGAFGVNCLVASHRVLAARPSARVVARVDDRVSVVHVTRPPTAGTRSAALSSP